MTTTVLWLWLVAGISMVLAAGLMFLWRRSARLHREMSAQAVRLDESRENLVTALNSMDALVYVSDMETCELLFANDYATRISGGQIRPGIRCWQALQKDMTGPCSFCQNPKLIEAGHQNAPHRWHLQNTLNNRWYEAREKVIPWPGHRQAKIHIGIDITEQRAATEALKESDQKWSSLFNAMQEIVALHELIVDEKGRPVNYRLLDCNHSYCQNFGLERQRVVGRLATEVYGLTNPPFLLEFSGVALGGEPCSFESYFAPMDRHFSISVVSHRKNQFATITSDITMLKKMQDELKAKNRELEQIIYVASHDLRSPLVNVDGYARELEFAIKTLGPVELWPEPAARALPDIADALHHIRASAHQMDNLLKGLLKLSRLGRAALNIHPLDMNHLIGQLIESTGFQIREADANVVVTNLPPCRGDDVHVTQVFANLLDNAIKYRAPLRPCEIRISGRSVIGYAIYTVEDNGVGIAPEFHTKIFELFHRLQPKATDGEGLGLTMTRQVLGRLGGTIQIESASGQGSRFIVMLPAAIEPPGDQKERTS